MTDYLNTPSSRNSANMPPSFAPLRDRKTAPSSSCPEGTKRGTLGWLNGLFTGERGPFGREKMKKMGGVAILATGALALSSAVVEVADKIDEASLETTCATFEIGEPDSMGSLTKLNSDDAERIQDFLANSPGGFSASELGSNYYRNEEAVDALKPGSTLQICITTGTFSGSNLEVNRVDSPNNN